MTRIAANLSMLFTDAPFLDRFDRAGAAGFDTVEFLFPYDHPIDVVKTRLDRNGLRLSLINAPAGDWAAGERGFAARPSKRTEFRASVEQAITFATGLGCPRIHVMSGITADEPDRAACEAVWTENLREAADMAASAGLFISIEPLNSHIISTKSQSSVNQPILVHRLAPSKDSASFEERVAPNSITGLDQSEAERS